MHLRCTEQTDQSCDDSSEDCEYETPKIEDIREIQQPDMPTTIHYKACGYILLARVDCKYDRTKKSSPTKFPTCDQPGKVCTLTDGEGIFSSECKAPWFSCFTS